MSKSLRNYPDPMELADRVGADAMRFYLLSSPVIRGEDLSFSEKEVLEIQRKNIGRLHNVLAMYEMFADGTKALNRSQNLLDQWILARLNQLIAESTAGYENYELDKATRPITDFIDDLSVWYLRRSRERLKGDDTPDKNQAIGTLRYTLRELALVMAPAMPFYAEYLWQAVREKEEAESVHLARWPEEGGVDEELLLSMATARSVVSMALEARIKSGIKVRQPLASLKVATEGGLHSELLQIIAEEVNVKAVIFTGVKSEETGPVVALDTTITYELKAEGDVREFMRAVQERRKAEGLAPQDRIELIVETTPDGEALLQSGLALIKKTVGATSVIFDVNSGDELTAGECVFRILLKKL